MELLRTVRGAAARMVGIPRKVDEAEFKRWRRESLDPVVRSGVCYVPMPGLEHTRHYKDKQNLHHLGRYEWACRVLGRDGVKQKRVLDCACGVGYGTAALTEVAESVDGVDVYDAAIRVARARFDRPNTTWHISDVAELRSLFAEGSFDAVVSFQTIESIEDGAAFLDDVEWLLRPGGSLLIDTPLRKHHVHKPENPHHRRYYALDEWLDMLVGRFETVQAFDSLPEGSYLRSRGLVSGGSIVCCVKQSGAIA